MNGTKDFHHDYGMKKGHAPIADKVICVDFDATLFPWGPLMNPDAKPLAGAVDATRKFAGAGFKVVIFTSRLSDRWLEDSGNDAIEQQQYVYDMCIKNGIPFTEITGEKIPAVAYIDDKAIEFTGTNWDDIAERVLTTL